MGLFGFGAKKERTLASLKRRAKVGSILTMVSNQLSGSDMALPDPILGKQRRVTSVIPDGICFDPNGPGGDGKRTFVWPDEPQEGFLGLIAKPNGVLGGFVDNDTFVVDYRIYYSIFRLDA